jgi:hypothetical protein
MSITTISPLTALIDPATGKGRAPKPVAPLTPLPPTTTLQPPTDYSASPTQNQSTKDIEDFVAKELNMSGGMRMGGGKKAPGFTFTSGPYAGLTVMQATEVAKKKYLDSKASPTTTQPFGKLGAPAAPLAPVRSSVATTPPPAGNDWALAGQARNDAANGIVSRGTDGSVQYQNGASIIPTTDASAGPPAQTSRSLVSPYGTGSVTNGPRTAPSRINMTNTYDPNFFKTAPAAPAPTTPPASASAATSLTPPTVATAPNQAFSPAYNALIVKQNQPPRNPAMDPWTGPDAASMASANATMDQAAANVAKRASAPSTTPTSLQPPSAAQPPPKSMAYNIGSAASNMALLPAQLAYQQGRMMGDTVVNTAKTTAKLAPQLAALPGQLAYQQGRMIGNLQANTVNKTIDTAKDMIAGARDASDKQLRQTASAY